MKIAVFGGMGKLGSAIVENLKKYYAFEVFDTKNGKTDCNFESFDLIIDASVHQNSVMLARHCAQAKKPLLVCTTGHTKKEMKTLLALQKQTTIEICPNLSFGINTINNWLKTTDFENCNVSIFERHHTSKKDSPSGTALHLANTCSRFANTLEIVSSRFGDDVGTHTLTLDMPHEQIIIIHKAKDRLAFALGAKHRIESIIREHKQNEN